MVKIAGNLLKMRAENSNPVQYELFFGEQNLKMNSLIGKLLSVQYLGKINCIRCGRETKTSFFQGFCYPCFMTAPETEECVLNPEKCRAHVGEARDMEFAESHCLIPHVVYLAESGGVKVGVTRITQVPVRWIDQGASQAIELARTPNRFLAGELEVALKKIMPDRTNWRRMLSAKGDGETDMMGLYDRVACQVPEEFIPFLSFEKEIVSLKYPVEKYPEKVTSVNLEKETGIRGILTGIRGQYLYFDEGRVLNIRKYGGYLVEIELAEITL